MKNRITLKQCCGGQQQADWHRVHCQNKRSRISSDYRGNNELSSYLCSSVGMSCNLLILSCVCMYVCVPWVETDSVSVCLERVVVN